MSDLPDSVLATAALTAPVGAPGSVIAARYVIGQRVGRGGMADVYAAEDRLLGRAVAIKIFRVDATPDARRRIEGEMRTLAVLRHPGLVTVFDAGTLTGDDLDTPYLVMELVSGPTLSALLRDGPLAVGQVARLGRELAATLAYVHANQVVHRDIKPANILLETEHSEHPIDGDGRAAPYTPKLADFGISTVIDADRFTVDGTTVGTPNYLSPEQAQGHPISPASDVYSLALVLIECLTGRVVYPGSGVTAAIARLRQAPAVPSRFGAGWQELLTAMTATDPAARPASAEVARSLAALVETPTALVETPTMTAPAGPDAGATQVLTEVPPSATAVLPFAPLLPPHDGPPSQERPRRRHRGVILAAVAALLVIGGLGFALSDGGTPVTPPASSTPSGVDHAAAPSQSSPATPAPTRHSVTAMPTTSPTPSLARATATKPSAPKPPGPAGKPKKKGKGHGKGPG